MNDREKMLKTIQTENHIWIIYLVLIGLSFYANSRETQYYLHDDLKSREEYRILNIIIFSIALAVYLYFFRDGYQAVRNLKPCDSESKKFFEYINLFGTSLIVIAGVIFLFIAICDENLETEIAFS